MLAVVTFVCAGLATALELVPPYLVKIVIDDVIQAKRPEMLMWVLGALLGSYILRNLMSSMRVRFNNLLEQKAVHTLRMQVFGALQRLSLSYFENRSTGEIMTRVTSDTEHVERIFVDGLEGLLTASLTLIGITIMMFFLNWKLALLSLVPIPILIVCAAWFTKRVHKYYAEIRKSVADLNAYLQDALSGIKETIGFNQHEYERKRFETLSQTYSQNSLRAMFLWSWYWPGMVFVGSTGTVLILWYGAEEVMAGNLTVGQLVMFLSYLGLFYTPINEIHSLNHMLQHALAASERVFEILDTKAEVEDRPGAVRPVERLRGAVEYRQVVFGYRQEGTVLSDVNLTVRPGERIALVGPSGAGKTSLLKLLMRFYDVRSGAVLVDGYDVRDLPVAFLRGQIGLVQQEPFLFNGTVRQNIVYSDLSASHERVEAAARAARAHDFITRLPDGYDSWIGERGVKLSVGQKQRVSIARVLLKDPPIIIFDEATSNIDTETEVKIREALNDLTKGRTTFIIAHRLATLHDVDRIIVVERGTIVEEGHHDALMKRGGVYAGLYEAQFKI
ncbi:MAG: ABC transporter ATP-binding protein [Nitrospira sp.]|nr:ABC transporter ATP-binding protein [Nitrospira sp.]MBX3342952.1 ABC transporter ATP-binding protein [Nitrospira sp.]MBX3371084.1 ABC transporter ATP-binding protein [Nitrospira sp.]MBX7039933.1 ABC transporter ATP-binding protein/permease [Nitrospira sp.]MCW5793613.1 ABC transporter ATP-binding protein [Nitrospira sp.]